MRAHRVAHGLALAAALAAGMNAGERIARAAAAPGTPPRTIVYPTHSAIVIDRIHQHWMTRKHATEAAYFTCVAFRNTDARDATAVLFHFAFYDANDTRVAESDLTRAGRFATGADIGDVPSHGERDLANCVQLPPLRSGVAATVVFVKSVTYADGSIWSTTGPAIPEHLGPPPMAVPATLDPLPSPSP